MNGGMEMFAAAIKSTLFILNNMDKGIPTSNWKPHIGNIPIKKPKPIDNDFVKLLSFDFMVSFFMAESVFFDNSFLGKKYNNAPNTRKVFNTLILKKSLPGLKCETRSSLS